MSTEQQPTVVLPDVSFVLYGELTRVGFDLVITNPAGEQFVVHDYFAFDPPPTLILEGGRVMLTPEAVAALMPDGIEGTLFAGPASSSEAGEQIGEVRFLRGEVTIVRNDGEEVQAERGTPIYKGDRVETGESSFVNIRMADRSVTGSTRFNLGADASSTFNDFAFEPEQQSASFDVFVQRGGFKYKSGGIGSFGSDLNHTRISTPSAIIRVRGSELEGAVDAQTGQTIVVHRSGLLEITDPAGGNPVELTTPGTTTVVTLGGAPDFFSQPTEQQQAFLQQNLPPPASDEADLEIDQQEQEEIEQQQDESETEPQADEGEEGTEEGAEEQVVQGEGEGEGEEGADADADEGAEQEGEDAEAEEQAEGREDGAESTSEGAEQADADGGEPAGEPLTEGERSAPSGTTVTSNDTVSEPDIRTDTVLDEGARTGTGTESDGGTTTDGGGDGSTTSPTEPVTEEPRTEPEPEPELPPDNPPEALDDSAAVTVGESLDLTTLVLENDSDPDENQTPRVAGIVADASLGTASFVDGVLTYTPDLLAELPAGATTTDSFVYRIVSGDLSDTATVQITITGVNDAPVAENDSGATDDKTAITLPNLLANDSDPDGDAITLVSIDTAGTQGIVTDNGDGTFSYDPAGQFSTLPGGATATDSFTYIIEDTSGLTASAVVTVTITAANELPIASPDSFVTNEDTPIATADPLTNDTDPDGDVLTLAGIDGSAALGSLTDNGDGTVAYDPGGQLDFLAAGQTTQETFTYFVSDGRGGTASSTVTVTVTGVNDVPVASDDVEATANNTVLTTANVLVNDTDVDTGDTLSIAAIDTTGTMGLVTDNGDGTFNYDPNGLFDALSTGQTAQDTFTYVIADTSGATSSATVTITVEGTNSPPVAVADAIAATEDAPVTANVLANDSDTDAGDTLTITVIDTAGTIGAVVDNGGGSLTYDPSGQFESLAAGQTATDSFIYTISDGKGGTATATVTITIDGVNDAPVATAETLLAFVGQSQVIDVLANDTDPDSGDVLTTSAPALSSLAGTVVVNGDNTITYTPNSFFAQLDGGETLTDEFTYTVTDSAGAAASATVTLSVGLDPAFPAAVDDYFPATPLSAFVTGNVLTNDFGGTGALSIVDYDRETGFGSRVLSNGDGTFTVFLKANFSFDGTSSVLETGARQEYFDYVVMDGAGNTSDAEVVIDIGSIDTLSGTTNTTTATTTLTNSTDYYLNNALLTVTGTSTVTGRLVNVGDLALAPGASLTVGTGIDDQGTIVVDSLSTLTVTGGLYHSGTLRGTGTVDVSGALFDGQFSTEPGFSVGTLTIIGDALNPDAVSFDSQHQFFIELDSSSSDQVVINGAADLDGALRLFTLGFFPSGGESFDVITTTDGYSGQIRNFELPVFDGFVIDPVQDGTTVTLNIVAPTTFSSGTITPDGLMSPGTELIAGSGLPDTFDLTANADGDSFYGDDGTDTFIIADLNFGRIDGGGPLQFDGDTLAFSTPDFDLRGVTAYQIDSVDTIDLVDGQAGTLNLDVDSALNISSTLLVEAEAGDLLVLDTHDGFFSRMPFDPGYSSSDVLQVGGRNADGDFASILVSNAATVRINEAGGEVQLIGSTGDDTLIGTAGNDFIVGRAGNDTIDAGAGDDEVIVESDDTTLVDGGAGVDGLLAGRNPGDGIDLTTNNPYVNFEYIDLGESFESNTLRLDITNVSQTGIQNLVFDDGTYQILIEGDIDDYVILNGQNLRDGDPAGLVKGTDPRFPDYVSYSDGTNQVLVETTLLGPGINHPPFTGADDVATDNATVLVIDPTANDFDPDPGDTFTLTSVQNVTGVGITLVDNGDGTFSYDPAGFFDFLAPGETASDGFTYTITDSFGATSTSFVNIVISANTSAPFAVQDFDATDEATILVTLDVLANDQNAASVIDFQSLSDWNADIKYNGNGTFTYDPDHQFDYLVSGETVTDHFRYVIGDGLGNTAVGKVEITVSGVAGFPSTFTTTDVITTATTFSNPNDIFRNSFSVTLQGTGNTIDGWFENSGLLWLDPGVDLTVGQGIDNFGSVELQTGSTLFVQNSDFDNMGYISGTGTLDFSTTIVGASPPVLEHGGYLEPGGSGQVGTVSVNGDTVFTSFGTLYAELTNSGQMADLLAVSGSAELSGELAVDAAGLSLTGAETFTVVTAGSVIGEFRTVSGLDEPSGGFVLDAAYTATDVTLSPLPINQQATTATTTLTATTTGQVLVGSTNTDTFNIGSLTTGTTIYGRFGNDTINADDFGFRRIDGGDGFDQLNVPGGDLSQLTSHYQLDRVDVVNVRNAAGETSSFDFTTLSYAASEFGEVSLLGDPGDVHQVSVLDFSWEESPVSDFQDQNGNQYFTYYLFGQGQQDFLTVNVSTEVRSEIVGFEKTLWYGSDTTDTFTDTVGAYNILISHGGDDVANLGGGYDEIIHDPSDVTPGNIDGGPDEDSVRPPFDTDIDLTAANPYVRVENIDLDFGGPNAVRLDMVDVAQMGSIDQYTTNGTTQVLISGEADDRVVLEGVLLHQSSDFTTLSSMGITVDDLNPVFIFDRNYIPVTDGSNTLYVSQDIFTGGGNHVPESSGTVTGFARADSTATFTVDLLSNAFDGNGDVLSISGLTPTGGNNVGVDDSAVVAGGTTLTVDPTAYPGTTSNTITYSYTIDDGFGGTSTAFAEIRLVGPVNHFIGPFGGSFNSISNWGDGVVPGSTDAAFIDASSVNTGVSAMVGFLELDNGAVLNINGTTSTTTSTVLTTNELIMGPGTSVSFTFNSGLEITGDARLDSSSSFFGTGTQSVNFSGPGANIQVPSGYTINGAPWVLDAGLHIVGGALLEVGSTGELRVQDGFSIVNTADFANFGNVVVSPASPLDISPWLHVHGDATNSGTITLDNLGGGSTATSTFDVFGGRLQNYSLIQSLDSNAVGGMRALLGGIDNYASIFVDYSLTVDTFDGDFYNADAGYISVSGGQTLTFVGGGNVDNDGTLDATIGTGDTLDVTAVNFVNRGTIQGFGSVLGTINDDGGTVTPGSSPGLMEVHGDYLMSSASDLEIELEGEVAGTAYDQVAVYGTAAVNGRLNVSLLNGYVPALSAGFLVLTAETLTGTFASADGLDVSDRVVLDLNYTDDAVELHAVAVTSAGSDAGETLSATAGHDVIVSGGGNDVILDLGSGDIVYGQGGDDIIQASSDFKRVDGGDGVDTLQLSDTADLGNIAGTTVDNIEVIDLRNGAEDNVELDADAVEAMVDGANDLTGVDNSLVLVGDVGDVISLRGDFLANGEQTVVVNGEEVSLRVFTEGSTSVLISPDLALEIYRTDGTVDRVAALSAPAPEDSVDLSGVETLVASGETGATDTELSLSDVLSDGGDTLDSLVGETGPMTSAGADSYAATWHYGVQPVDSMSSLLSPNLYVDV